MNGGWIGTGLFQGLPTYIPHVRTDMIFAAIVEEFGAIFAIMLVMIYMLIFLFIMDTAKREKDLVRRGVAMGFGILYMLQSFVIIGGVIKLIPLTGVTLPFVSYGGSSLLSSFLILGVLPIHDSQPLYGKKGGAIRWERTTEPKTGRQSKRAKRGKEMTRFKIPTISTDLTKRMEGHTFRVIKGILFVPQHSFNCMDWKINRV